MVIFEEKAITLFLITGYEKKKEVSRLEVAAKSRKLREVFLEEGVSFTNGTDLNIFIS